jgi:putative membrane protein insertion efficiency factor
MKILLSKIILIPKYIVLFLIFIYQKIFSFDHGPLKIFYPNGYCRYFPSCSMYAREAIKKRGLVVGSLKSLYRIARCNPWSKGGIDLP